MPDMVTRLAKNNILGLSEGLLNNGMVNGKNVAMTAMVLANKDLVVDLAALLIK
jgi:hypothetical protein